MIAKLQHLVEAGFLYITFKVQPFFACLMAIGGLLYYLSMLKMNVIDVKHEGSWKKYFKSIFKL